MDDAKIKFAVIGLNFGRHIAADLLRPGPASSSFELVAVCDADAKRATAVGANCGVPICRELADLLADPEIEAVGLFTGPVGRAELIRQIIRAGKHVLTTKPFETDPQQAADVLREARSLGRIVHLNSPAPTLTADLRQVRTWQKEFALGEPVAFRAETWANYREQADGSWYDDPEKCPVAPIFRLGIYLINDLVRLFGEPESVQVMHSRVFTKRPTPDNAQLGLRFRSGALGNVFASFCINDSQLYADAVTLNFENGTIRRSVARAQALFDIKTTHLSLLTGAGETRRAEMLSVSGDYEWTAFAQAIRGEMLADETSIEQIVGGLRVIAAMSRAEKTGRTEPL